jgi:pyruvate kinase
MRLSDEAKSDRSMLSPASGDGATLPTRDLEALLAQLEEILSKAREREENESAGIGLVDPEFQKSALNLVHYLALRNVDLRPLQEELSQMGLSSLGRTEAHVLASLMAVRHVLGHLSGRPATAEAPPISIEEGPHLLARHTEALFGPAPRGRAVRIMVTLPTEAADDYVMVRDMIAKGMDCARINCAHDGPDLWKRMAANVRKASDETGRTCRILMDVNGPKIRTGPMEPGPKVVHWRPYRDARGQVIAPARIWLSSTPDAPLQGLKGISAVLPVEESWLRRVEAGDRMRFRDARAKKRSLDVLERHPSGCLALSYESAYVETGNKLKLEATGKNRKEHSTRIGELPAAESFLLLRRGETLILREDLRPGRPAERAEDGSVRNPAFISCTLPEVFTDVQPQDIVKLNDGKIEGVVRAVTDEGIHVEITYAKEGGSKLRADKSINFPQTALNVSGLTPKDREDLEIIVQIADMVGLSFVNSAEDVTAMCDALSERHAEQIGIVLKIETKQGFEQLPGILMAALRRYPVGVMIARGDLAVECGWERMAEVQEEILWLSEAAHVPVIWATQVLENLAKKGQPSRAEITDAAMAERAECVMLNKGPHLLKAIETLDDILGRMQAHQQKKTSMLRSLVVARES